MLFISWHLVRILNLGHPFHRLAKVGRPDLCRIESWDQGSCCPTQAKLGWGTPGEAASQRVSGSASQRKTTADPSTSLRLRSGSLGMTFQENVSGGTTEVVP